MCLVIRWKQLVNLIVVWKNVNAEKLVLFRHIPMCINFVILSLIKLKKLIYLKTNY